VLAEGSFHVPAPELASRLGGFDSFFVMSDEGRILAQWPSAAPPVYERRFTFRDYFRGARYLADTGTAGAYVARAFRSESHGLLEFGISAPVMDRGRQIGLVVGTLSAKSAFGAVRMEDSPQSGPIITTLVGPRGNDRAAGPDAPAPSDFTFLVHPGMGRGAAHALAAPSPSALRAAFGLSAPPGQQFSLQYVRALQLRSYRDPVPGFDGEWLAALAPVGKTGYLVLVQTRKSAALAWLRPSSPLRAASAGAALLLTCAVGLGIGRWRARSNRRDRPAPTRRPRRPPTGNEAREQLVTGEDHAITPCAGSATRARSR
jgi:hypothetical protein